MTNNPKFKVGDQVFLIDAPDQIGTIQKYSGMMGNKHWFKVRIGKDIRSYSEDSLEFYSGEMDDLESLFVSGRFGQKTSFSRILTQLKLNVAVKNNLYALFASRTEFHAYQYKPLLKYLNSEDRRLLIADEVGLGKTIETGLILIEERARNPLERILIICPSSLTRKWQDEMKIRFDEEFEIWTRNQIIEFLEGIRKGEIPKGIKVIVSLQSMRNRKVLGYLEELQIGFDMVVFDEAHHLRNSTTLSHRLGRILASNSDSVLLLTATPIHLKSLDLFNLLRILRPQEFDNQIIFENLLKFNKYIVNAEREIVKSNPDTTSILNQLKKLKESPERNRFEKNPIYADVLRRLEAGVIKDRRKRIELQKDINSLNMLSHIINRTRKRDVREIIFRKAITIQHEFVEEEKEFYHAVTEFVKDKYRQSGKFGVEVFAAMMYQRQVASCIPAMVEHYEKLVKHLKIIYEYALVTEEQSDLEQEDYFENGNFEEENLSNDLLVIDKLITAYNNVKNIDTKYDTLLNYLKQLDVEEPGRKIILFSYFRKTLEYLSNRLQKDGFKNFVIYGKIKSSDRYEIIQQFREDPEIRILLSSEVGSEGLDLQFCNILVNYDLPWNPMKVEQRIGRLDRFGQKAEKIIIINIVTKDTIEEKIFNRLYERIEIFKNSIGDLEPILGEAVKEITKKLFSSKLTPEEIDEKINLIADNIIRKRVDEENLEKESAKLIGFDEYFRQEIERFQKHHYYISGDELKIYVKEFLNENFPTLKLSTTKNEKIYNFPVNNQFVEFLRKSKFKDDFLLSPFFEAFYSTKNNELKVTFDSEEANRDKKIIFINNNHPLIRIIKDYYNSQKGKLYPLAKAKVLYKDLQPGLYFFIVFMVQFTGARPEKRIETIVYEYSKDKFLDQEEGDNFINYVKIHGKDWDMDITITQNELSQIYNKIVTHFHELMEEKKRELQRINESLIEVKKATINNAYNYKIQKREELLKKVTHEGIRRMHNKVLITLKNELFNKIEEIEANRNVRMSYQEFAAGIIKNVEDA